MPRNSRNRKFYTAIAFFVLVIFMTLWAVITSYMNGTLGSMEIFNWDILGLSDDSSDGSEAFTTLFTTLVIIAALILFLVLGIRQHKQEEAVISEDERLLESDLSDIDLMRQDEFDAYLIALFRKMGYKSEEVDEASNPGVNVLLHRGVGDNVVVYAPITRRRLDNTDVDKVVEARDRNDAQAGWIITNSRYERKSINYAKSKKLRLVDRKILMNIVSRATREDNFRERMMGL